MNKNVYIVILAGGSGTRFWPYSRKLKPKQFLDVIGIGRTLLQMTFDRFLNITSADKILIASNDKYERLIKEQLPELKDDQILLEPEKRNTAPCIAYVAYKILQKDPEAVLVVSPSDHVIFKESEFKQVISIATEHACSEDHLITIGIRPNRPETGYGYIQYLGESDATIKKVKTFTEKPQFGLAKKFLESGDFLWNSGIFVWSTSSIIKAFEKYESEIASMFAEGLGHYHSTTERDFISKTYSHCKSISIDYAIMEKADNVFVVPANFGWSDLGSWNALYEIQKKDENDNVIIGSAITYNSHSNYIRGKKEKVIVAHDLKGYLIADFDDVLLICKKEESAIIRDFISDVRAKKGEKYV